MRYRIAKGKGRGRFVSIQDAIAHGLSVFKETYNVENKEWTRGAKSKVYRRDPAKSSYARLRSRRTGRYIALKDIGRQSIIIEDVKKGHAELLHRGRISRKDAEKVMKKLKGRKAVKVVLKNLKFYRHLVVSYRDDIKLKVLYVTRWIKAKLNKEKLSITQQLALDSEIDLLKLSNMDKVNDITKEARRIYGKIKGIK